MDQQQLTATNANSQPATASSTNSVIMHHLSQTFSSPQSLFSSNMQHQMFCNSSTTTANSSLQNPYYSSLNSLYNNNNINNNNNSSSCTTVNNMIMMMQSHTNASAVYHGNGNVSPATDVEDELSTLDWGNAAQFGELLAIDELLDFPNDDGTGAATVPGNGGADGSNCRAPVAADVASGASTTNSGIHSTKTVDSNYDTIVQLNSSSDTASSVSPKVAIAEHVNPIVLQATAGPALKKERNAAGTTDAAEQAASNIFETGGLCVPSDDFAELEWLSHFVEDSMSSGVDMSCSNYNMFLQSCDNSRKAASADQNRTTAWAATRAGSNGTMIGAGALQTSTVAGKTLVKFNSSAPSPDSVLENSTAATVADNQMQRCASNFSSPRNYSAATGIMSDGCTADDEDEDAFGLQYNGSGVQKAARSKRSRNGACFWNSRILSTVEAYVVNNGGSPASATAAMLMGGDSVSPRGCMSTSATGSGLFYKYRDYKIEDCEMGYGVRLTPAPPARKKTKVSGVSAIPASAPAKKAASAAAASVASDSSDGQGSGRKCLHCGAQKTPQWRAGPMGPKTLCNACGVRFKSGRLLPEYRPAASPTFVESVHSNSHRRVLEMRRQKGCPDGAAATNAASFSPKRHMANHEHSYFQTSSSNSAGMNLTPENNGVTAAGQQAQLPRPNSNSNLHQFSSSASASFSSAIAGHHAQLGAQLVN